MGNRSKHGPAIGYMGQRQRDNAYVLVRERDLRTVRDLVQKIMGKTSPKDVELRKLLSELSCRMESIR